MGLFQLWNNNFFREEFYINREEVMDFSKIGSKSTYHRCIKELSHWGYILYTPSHNPFKGSRIKMFEFGTSSGQVVYTSRTKNETTHGQAMVPKRKQIQSFEKTGENRRKGPNFKNPKLEYFESEDKPSASIPYKDNLRTCKDKDYNEPL